MTVEKYYKNSTEGYLVLHMYATEIKNSDIYFKNGKKVDASECGGTELKGCVPIKEKKYQFELRKTKKGKI
jgi:hypothetical protein